MANRFEPDFFDRECPHGLGLRADCGICNGHIKLVRTRKAKPAEQAKVVKPKCTICLKKAETNLGHMNHRRYVGVYDPSTVHGRSPGRAITHRQVRAVWDATHTDDAGRLVCDECCNDRCTRCKNFDPTLPSVGRVTEVKTRKVSVTERLLTDDSGMWQHIAGVSTSAQT